jgi:hypothetical protein
MHFSPNILRVIKSRRMRWAGHVACIEEKFLVGKIEGTDTTLKTKAWKGE